MSIARTGPNREPAMASNRSRVIEALLNSGEPSIRWKMRVRVGGEDPESQKIRDLREEIRKSPRAQTLLAGRDKHPVREEYVYAKWRGAHWTLAALADIGYPEGDKALLPMCKQVLDQWLGASFYSEFELKSGFSKNRRAGGAPIIRGRYRHHASQQGNALLSLIRLGLADTGRKQLAELLLRWQWPDGGWNCDRNPSADTSSFMESLLPMRALFAHAEQTGDKSARAAAMRAAEIFLTRRIFKRRSDGKVIHPNFLTFHYPLYWHYDVLGGLVAMAEMGLIKDPRCGDALDLLERKELPKGGWAAGGRFYKVSANTDFSTRPGSLSLVDWGGSGHTRINEWATADALYVLKAAARL
jgi:hypothetical protein